ncbi:hypothetical protein, conserved [Trypanosoma brucei brucei TREU927]|uniref:tRNA (guanine(9)-N(1))-methyltransferase n=1 Tax=Trypanosoma brucei brucei (strain 927/4 GUTat10.1) TaxID=185431 RepID=Q587A8_TRYB2|nr:hypothetical protein, conserved [Trypanosoma brucei brucei TREU927]AAX79269.1 hypothetical protein, conserved [Trypanosoma brucei]AAZ12000.1 hypothetical protein, conserved [Trypanosoma brucei brucei TREU927]
MDDERTTAAGRITSTNVREEEPSITVPCELDTHIEQHERRKRGRVWTAEEQAAYWREKKEKQRQRKKAAAAERREMQQKEWEALSQSERERRRAEAIAVHEKRRGAEMRLQQLCQEHLADAKLPVLVFDLSFAWCMNASDCRSTVSQVKLSYSALRRHAFPLRPVITSIGGSADGEMACAHSDVLQSLCTFNGFSRYPLPVHENHWSSLYDLQRVVFLTADAEVVLERIEQGTVYIVGAFVDHNARKFLTRDAAIRYGVRMARLPIDESIKVGNICKVLTVNHVVDVLCRYTECGDWSTAFDVLPTRRTVSRRERRTNAHISMSSNTVFGECDSVDTDETGGTTRVASGQAD